ncbi:gamma-glutamyltransferase family protein [Oscillochloris sp. ZM17-4]|uniref:gamma-glutamyltransferase family protein n=1 Tax=Oscillochloris sp. ZM17-4 TaxID=2866714 RepID=UPI001C73419A|nr:gamma-glutamyltransferase family protein [Oscillochloris sp. ZM17-4]MBX0327672.1 gamma-glutamyltransferase family protein [Oscillochloris sp. ZM17-4]
MELNLLAHPYAARRSPLVAANGVVATSHPLASQAGLRVLQDGGNAIDAALAAAAALAVLEPPSNGLGGDGFALIWEGGRLHGITGSGRAPAGLSVEALERAGHSAMPTHGWLPVTVPGVVRLWDDMHARFGSRPLAQLFAQAIAYAEDGAPVPPSVAASWARGVAFAQQRLGPEFSGFLGTYAPGGRAPRPGERFRSPGHARTLRAVAAQGARAFYEGEIAQAIAAFSRETGGLITAEDLAAHTSEWVEPISVDYRGYTVHEIPPSGQGIAALMALGALENLDLARHPRDSDASYHLQVEAIKLAFADAFAYVGDPAKVDVPIAAMLDRARLADRARLIGEAAGDFGPGELPRGGTVYFCAADRDGRMVSMIQSTYMGFGSGVVVPGWGISLHNRGNGFVTTPGHPNCVAPGRRPFHTIIPGFLTRGGQPVGPFGVMGGHMQPQGHAQVVVNSLDYGMHPQAALDAPRWRWEKDDTLRLELETPRHIVEGLAARGHQVIVEAAPGDFGRGQIIWRQDDGSYVAGTDMRCDGVAVGW